MIRRRNILALALSLLAFPAMGGFISIDSTPSVFVEDGQVTAVISLYNLGDEPAYNVTMRASCDQRHGASSTLAELPPDKPVDLRAKLGEAPSPDGIYSVVYTISYSDSGGKTYSALNTISLVTDLDAPPKNPVSLQIENAALDGKTELAAVLSSREDVEKVTVTLYLPDEFSARKAARSIALRKGEELPMTFSIRNRTANEGSIYLALVVTDHTLNGMHVSKATPFNIKVSSAVQPAKSPGLFIMLVILATAGVALQFPKARSGLRLSAKAYCRVESAIVVACLLALEIFLLCNLQPQYLLMDTTTVGGDTPAHNYIASHLRESLFGHGRIVSWGGGWWCGFPIFQFYFTLPYLLMAILDLILPFNIAFKTVCVAGILAIAPAAWLAGRMIRLPRPIPLVLALFTIPLLFDHSHEMWGVNIYSTLAGMISNSLSFPIMLLFIASAWRDTEDQRFRPLTVALLVAVLASHFFTSIIGILTVAIMPFIRKKENIAKSLMILAGEISIALAIMAWWLLPLITRMEYTADFGTNWPNIAFFEQLPRFSRILSPLLLPALVMLAVKRARVLIVLIWMLAASTFLFFFGFGISSVFVNVRLWPFIICSLIMLEAVGLGYLLSFLPAKRALIPAATAAVLMFSIDAPNHVPAWAKWNFEGLESKQHYAVFEKLVLPLEGTPGRLANDLCHENNMLGSSRIFELAPHLTGKPILEGGIVNSAAGSMFSYYIQSETSRNCAGFPSNVEPTVFNFTNATKHLELFNVKHFIARWETTRQALADHRDWRFIGREQQWELFELMSHDGSPVFVPRFMPMTVEMHEDIIDWKAAGLAWIYNIASIDQHFVILPPGSGPPEGFEAVSPSRYLSVMEARDPGLIDSLRSKALPTPRIDLIEATDYVIEFKTSKPGIPHIVKSTWYPNWLAKTGEEVYMVTPCFMMVIPNGEHVRLQYSRTATDMAGISISAAGLILLLALSSRRLLNRRSTP